MAPTNSSNTPDQDETINMQTLGSPLATSPTEGATDTIAYRSLSSALEKGLTDDQIQLLAYENKKKWLLDLLNEEGIPVTYFLERDPKRKNPFKGNIVGFQVNTKDKAESLCEVVGFDANGNTSTEKIPANKLSRMNLETYPKVSDLLAAIDRWKADMIAGNRRRYSNVLSIYKEVQANEAELQKSLASIHAIERARIAKSPVVIANNNDWLHDDIREVSCEAPDGLIDKRLALATAKTADYNKPSNEDTVGYNRKYYTSVVTDGLGGQGHGDQASEIVTRELCSVPFEKYAIIGATTRASEEIEKRGLGRAAACFAMTYARPGEEIMIAEAGDCSVVIADENNNILATSEGLRAQKGIDPQSFLEELDSPNFQELLKKAGILGIMEFLGSAKVDKNESKQIAERILSGQKPSVLPEMKCYRMLLAKVSNVISSKSHNPAVYGTGIIARAGLRIYKFTDGVTDIVKVERIMDETRAERSPREALETISHIVQDIRENRTDAKRDNLAVVVEFIESDAMSAAAE